MFRKYIISLILTFIIVQASVAQTKENTNHFELETDPIAFIFKGYSAHAGYQSGHFRWDVGVYGIEVPSFFSGYDNFNIRSNGGGVKLDYIFKKRKGLLLGVESNISREQVSPKSNDSNPDKDLTKSFTNVSLSMRVGYRWMLGSKSNDYKGFYIFPWVSFVSVNLNPQSAIIQGQEYKQSTFSFFPTVHFGYSF